MRILDKRIRDSKEEDWDTFNCDPKMHLRMEVVDKLMRLRNIKNYTDLAGMVDLHRTQMVRVTRGYSLPSHTTMARLCVVLGCQPADLLYVDYNFRIDQKV